MMNEIKSLYDPTMPTRPVLSRDEALTVGRRILELTSADDVRLKLEHQVIGSTRVNRMGGCASQDYETAQLTLQLGYGAETPRGGSQGVSVQINQFDDDTLRAVVPFMEQLAKSRPRPQTKVFEGVYNWKNRPTMPVNLWHERTIGALRDDRGARLADMMAAVQQAKLTPAIFIGTCARAACVIDKRGQQSYAQTTDAEVDVTCWTPDGKGSGWGGATSRDWAKLDPMTATHDAIDIAKRSMVIQALEPGRRTAILGPAAVAQLVAQMGYAFQAENVEMGRSPFTKPGLKYPVHTRVFDPRVSMTSDPADPDGGYYPFFWNTYMFWDDDGYPQGRMEWVVAGQLKQLAYGAEGAAIFGLKNPAETPRSLRLDPVGETSTIEEMIASCESGIYVNRLSDVMVADQRSGVMSGVTRDGCFLVKDGKIDRAVKNYRFLDSPFFALNSLLKIGASKRVALGAKVGYESWPLSPIIVPPIMVRDFNFASLADAV